MPKLVGPLTDDYNNNPFIKNLKVQYEDKTFEKGMVFFYLKLILFFVKKYFF